MMFLCTLLRGTASASGGKYGIEKVMGLGVKSKDVPYVQKHMIIVS